MSDPSDELRLATARADEIADALIAGNITSDERAALAEEAAALTTRVAELIAIIVRPS